MMSELVSMQVALLIEPLVAVVVWANEWFLSGVNAHVRLEVEVEREALAAEVALVGFLPRVHQHVPLQLRVIQEPLPT